MTTNADIRRAFNAAGRSIIAHIMGVDVLHASIVPEVGVSYDPRTTDRQQLLILAGGRAGEVVGLGYADDTDDQTTDHMRALALSLVDGDAVAADVLLLGKQREARRLLARYRPSLMILAEAIVEQHTIDWPRPGNIIDAAQRSRRRRQGRRQRRRSGERGAAQRSTTIPFLQSSSCQQKTGCLSFGILIPVFLLRVLPHRPPTAPRQQSEIPTDSAFC